MTRISCEQARDLAPEVLDREVDPDVRAALEAHLATCGACRAETDVVRAVRRAVLPLPTDLQSRVLAAAGGRRASRGGTAGRLAMAATLAAAVLGGSLLFRGQRDRAERPPQASPDATATFPLLDDPLLRGAGSALGQLTESELQTLLERMES